MHGSHAPRAAARSGRGMLRGRVQPRPGQEFLSLRFQTGETHPRTQIAPPPMNFSPEDMDLNMTEKQTPPSHLEPQTAAWYRRVCADYELEPHHLKLLLVAAESWDRNQAARIVIQRDGMTF